MAESYEDLLEAKLATLRGVLPDEYLPAVQECLESWGTERWLLGYDFGMKDADAIRAIVEQMKADDQIK